MKFEVPETTTCEIVFPGGKTVSVDSVLLFNKIVTLYTETDNDEWISEFCMYLKQEHDLELELGQAELLAEKISVHVNDIKKKLSI